MRFRALFLICAWMCSTGLVSAEVKLPSIFSDNAVLQADKKIPVWGWAEVGQKVTVTVGDQQATAIADKEGNWKCELGPFKAGQKPTMTVNDQVIKNVLVGEVWLCSGQSNMAWTVSKSNDFDAEKAAAKYPEIRMFKVANNPKPVPQANVAGQWIICSPETVGGFTAAGYFFGRKLHQDLKVPVGLINSSVGGTAIESWTSLEAQEKAEELKGLFKEWKTLEENFDQDQAQAKYENQLARWKELAAQARKEGKKPPRRPVAPASPRLDRNHPTNLFNGMINPLVPYAIRGAIWYQGERNARSVETAMLYRAQLPLMIADWRARWGQGDFPFFWVQLPNFKKRTNDPGETSAWAVMRESMAKSLKVPNTGMAVTIDVGEAGNIHPKNKQDPGKRLAFAALATVYKKDGPASGPLYDSHKVDGNRMVLTFKHTDGGLMSTMDMLKGFAIQDADKKWHWAKSKIDGDKVIVWHPEVEKPQAVRYAWGDNPEASLVNGAGLPAGPFRTNE